ncbi:MAG: SDR family oxidoreductase [Proteobacteria bacterium]|nr:SDR family oxidoreductase [Pseudomonadota bacterium]
MEVLGKAAIITGGGTGVGRATGLALAKLGCSVLVNYSRSRKAAEQTAADIEKLGVKALPWKADVSVDSECRAMTKAAIDAFGQVSILVNNAGTTSFINHRDLDAVKDEDWERLLNVNLKGPFQCARAVKEPIDAAGGGAIVNVASTAGINAQGSSIPYCASKAGLINLTISLARIMAPAIRVNAVAPSFIAGSWLEQGLGENYGKMKERMEKKAPLHKVCEPEDVADAILGFIIGSDLITGQIMQCDGGMSIAY